MRVVRIAPMIEQGVTLPPIRQLAIRLNENVTAITKCGARIVCLLAMVAIRLPCH
jgi:hypothetical protein